MEDNNKEFEGAHEGNFEEDKSANYSVKTTEGVKSKVDRLAEETNISKKDLFAMMVELLEINLSSQVYSDFTKDIEAFRVITERMLRLFTNVIERASSTRENDNKNWLDKFEEKEEDLNKLKEELNNYKATVAEAKEIKKQLEAANNELTIKLQDNQKSLDNVQLLTDEYKAKIDFLTNQLVKFEGYEAQNLELEKQIAEITKESVQTKTVLENTVNVLEQKVGQLEKDIDFEKKQKELDIKEAIVDTREKLQIQIDKNNEKHQATIDSYLEKMDQLRDANELALNKQKEEFDKERAQREELFAKERAQFEQTLSQREEASAKEKEAFEAKIKELEAKLAKKDNNTSK